VDPTEPARTDPMPDFIGTADSNDPTDACACGPAMFLLDERSRLLHANRLAGVMLRAGPELRLERTRLVLGLDEAQARFARLVRSAARVPSARARGLSVHREAHLPLTLLIGPHRRGAEFAGSAVPAATVQVTVRDPHLSAVDGLILQDLFGLTSAEAVVAAAIADGQSTAQIAQALGVQRNTVNAHLKRVQAKTGLRRQTLLASTLQRCVAVRPVNRGATVA
jgi:DNA-binding CsgD family transcriptional regulator